MFLVFAKKCRSDIHGNLTIIGWGAFFHLDLVWQVLTEVVCDKQSLSFPSPVVHQIQKSCCAIHSSSQILCLRPPFHQLHKLTNYSFCHGFLTGAAFPPAEAQCWLLLISTQDFFFLKIINPLSMHACCIFHFHDCWCQHLSSPFISLISCWFSLSLVMISCFMSWRIIV